MTARDEKNAPARTQDLINRLITYSKCLGGLVENNEGDAGPLKAPLETAMRKVLLELGDSDVNKLDVVFAAKLMLRLWTKFFPDASVPWMPHTGFQTDDLSQLEYFGLGPGEATDTGFEATVHFNGLAKMVKLTLQLVSPLEKTVATGDGDSVVEKQLRAAGKVLLWCRHCCLPFPFRLENAAQEWPCCPTCGTGAIQQEDHT
jgi:hypothetical protein